MLDELGEGDAFTTSFDERARYSAMKQNRETGARQSLEILSEIEESEMRLADVATLDRYPTDLTNPTDNAMTTQ